MLEFTVGVKIMVFELERILDAEKKEEIGCMFVKMKMNTLAESDKVQNGRRDEF